LKAINELTQTRVLFGHLSADNLSNLGVLNDAPAKSK
jgi:hypothetical protein